MTGRQSDRAAADAPPADVPTLADGVELVGEYEGSGLKETPYIVRRGDGRMIQLPRLLYLVAESIDGRSQYDAVGIRVSEAFGRRVSGDDVRFLVEEKLRPLGLVGGADGAGSAGERHDPSLALRFRAAVVPQRAVRAVAETLAPLFRPPIVVAVLGALIALDVWLFGLHGIAQSARDLLYEPASLLVVLGLVVLAAVFHECGHAAACRYGGGEPGVMGAGLYLGWPAFYTDVTDAYRLSRGGRLRTDLGGAYFNAIFVLAAAAAYFATGFEPLLVLVVVQHLQTLHQLLPLARLDGYHVISDLTGVPDILARVKPTLRSLVPGKQADASVSALKPWVRVATTAYILALVPALLVSFTLLVLGAPRVLATAWDSLMIQIDTLSDGDLVSAIGAAVEIAVLVLPLAAMGLALGGAANRIAAGAWRLTATSPAARAGAVGVAAVAAAFAAFTLWPNGEYKPIQAGEHGAVRGAVAVLAEIDTGRPSLTRERERQLAGAPTKRTRRDRQQEPSDERSPQAPVPSERRRGTPERTPTTPDSEVEAPQPETAPAETAPTATTTPETETVLDPASSAEPEPATTETTESP